MNELLTDTLARRADRAEAAPDVARLLAGVQARVQQRRRRRIAAQAGGASAVVIALAVAGLGLAPGTGSGGTKATGPAGVSRGRTHQPSAPSSAARTWTRGSAVPTTTGSAPGSATSTARAGGHLVVAAATPANAPLALALVPAGFSYLGSLPGNDTVYAPPGSDGDPTSFAGKLALLVGTRYGQPRLPLVIGNRSASIEADGSDPGGWIASIAWTNKVMITIQVPSNAHLNRSQVLRMAQTLIVRTVSHPGRG